MYKCSKALKTLLPYAFLAVLSLGSCTTERVISKKVSRVFRESPVIDKYQVGFALFDMQKDKMIYQKDAQKYFTPASNTKLFTFYGGLKMLSDSIPALRYIERGDSLIFWGTGDPSFLQSALKGKKAYEFLKNSGKKLFFAPGRYTGDFYGNGWQWDDYNAYYQAEISELPIKENMVTVSATNNTLKIEPAIFRDCFVADSTKGRNGSFRVNRDFNSNVFTFPKSNIPQNYNQQIPYKVSTATTLNILSDTLKRPVALINMKIPADAKTIFNAKKDDVLREMMLPSDNFIAEQLLLVYADQLGAELNAGKAIRHIESTYLSTLPDKIKWVDGSGLSRGNLFTPRDMIALLQLIYKEVNDTTRLYSMLPAGGKSGTLRNAYPKTDQPFVYGKTGTLSGTHNQSGYVLTKKGKTYIFSFMNNNYVEQTATVRNEMVRIMTYIHDNF